MEGPAGGLVTLWTVRSPKPGKSVESLAQTGRPQAAAGEGGGFVQVRRGAFTAVVVAGSLALAGCSGGGEDPPPTTSSTSSSSSTSSTPSATTQSPSATKTVALPPEATQHTEAGAKAFAKYYLLGLSEAEFEGDTSRIAPLTGKGCSACLKFIERIETRARQEQHVDRKSLSIETTALVDGDPTGRRAVIGVLANDAAKKVVNSEGDPIQAISGAKINFEASLEWSATGWAMAGLVVK